MSILNDLLNQVLNFFYSFSGDWGITIVFTTIAVRICLVPLSWFQKKRIAANTELSEKVEALKKKYKNDPAKLQTEMLKLTSENKMAFWGFLLPLIQLPIMVGLYRVFSGMNAEPGSLLVPWVSSLKLPDATFIVPLLTALIQLIPNLIMQLEAIKASKKSGLSLGSLFIMGAINILFMVKAPVTIGIYWFTSGIFSILEQLAYRVFPKKLTHNAGTVA